MRSLGLNPTNKEIADLIAEVDKNGKSSAMLRRSEKPHCLGNQRLDFQEFVAFMSKHWHERDQEAELRDAFRLFDRDNSGYITINELKQVFLHTSMAVCRTHVFFLIWRWCWTWAKNWIKKNWKTWCERSVPSWKYAVRPSKSSFHSRPMLIEMVNLTIKVKEAWHVLLSTDSIFSLLEFVQKLLSTS